MADTQYITTPIYYVNDIPHLGHAYTTIAADTLARYWRSQGTETWFLTGTDEHGQKIEKTAEERGMTPQQLADSVVVRFQDAWKRLGISEDDFIRTTEARHKRVVQEMWQRLQSTGDLYLGSYEGWYCVADEAFYTEKELVNGMSPTGRPVELVKEPSWFFRLSAYQDRLLEWYRNNPDCIAPKERYNEIVSFVEGGLHDLSVSRARLNWGIKVPGDEEHTVYVWLDALTNYLSALGGPDSEMAQKFWPATHLIGKDILRFHAVYWPAFLMSAGLPLPRKIFAHGWWTIEGQKMSKTTRNVVDPNNLVDDYGIDPVRYFVLREVSFGSDGDFSHSALIGRLNNDLANDLGNLVSRTQGMLKKYYDSKVPAATIDAEIAALKDETEAAVRSAMEALAFHRALEAIWKMISRLNQYVQQQAPWVLAKEGRDEALANCMATLWQGCAWLAPILDPFVPGTAARIKTWATLDDERKTGELETLFPRMDEKAIEQRLEKVQKLMTDETTTPEADSFTPEPLSDETTIDAFFATDLRVGLVVDAEDLPKSKKLLKLSVDLGEEKPRQILAGIKLHFSPEDLKGRKVAVVANLKPAKLMGLESQGMVLAASAGDSLTLVDPGDLPPGARIK